MSNPPVLSQKKQHIPRALIVAVQLNNVRDVEFESSLEELANLAKTLGLEVMDRTVVILEIFTSCEVLEERADAEGAFFRFRALTDVVARLKKTCRR